jgi:beta-lactamase regulating signal transducer with metallopeptidase domain
MTPMFALVEGIWPLAPADSARAAEGVYTASLLILVPLIVAVAAAVALRNTAAGTRALVWRAAVVSLLLVFLGRLLPVGGAWTVPDFFATTLVVLGRIQVGSADVGSTTSSPFHATSGADLSSVVIVALVLLYLAGVALVVVQTWRAWRAVQMQALRATAVRDSTWLALLAQAKERMGLRRPISLLLSDSEAAPATWGVFRPVVLLPPSAMKLSISQRRALLLHELAHIRCGDWLFGLAARLVRALYWFHPAAWIIAGKLRSECEAACDDQVLAAGVLPTDYASLLMSSSRQLPKRSGMGSLVQALHTRGGLRERIRAVLDPDRRYAAPSAAVIVAVSLVTLVVATPTATAQLAPGREVLTGLMQDARWQSRAYAAGRLAQRPDSLVLAQNAALLDPSPQVRAWAQRALNKQAAPSLPSPTGVGGPAQPSDLWR